MIAGRKSVRRAGSEDPAITELEAPLPSYIPLHPHLPSNHYNYDKRDFGMVAAAIEYCRD